MQHEYLNYEDIGSAQTVGLHCGPAGNAEEIVRLIWGGGETASTDAVAFRGRMGNSDMQMAQILIACWFPTRKRCVSEQKEEGAVKNVFVRLPGGTTFSHFYTVKQQLTLCPNMHIATCFFIGAV